MENSDLYLLSKIIKDDVRSYEAIFNKYWEMVFKFIVKKTGDYSQAEDIVQEVFLLVWNRRNSLHIHTNLKNYLLAVAKYMYFKSIDTQTLQLDGEELEACGIDPYTPETCLEFDELHHRYLQCIEKLPEKYKEVFKLSQHESLSITEISAKLKLAPQTVSNRLTASKQLIRQDLKKHYPLLLFLFLN